MNEYIAILRADYLLFRYRTQLYKNGHGGRGFLSDDDTEAHELKQVYESLVEKVQKIKDGNLYGLEIFSKEWWEKLGYKLV